jgi:predicted nucleic acid-binding Zn ribbon protein
VAPDTLLGRVQGVWQEAAGAAVAAESAPASEREGTVTVECSGAVWAQELTLLETDLRERLNARLGAAQVRSLRFKVKTP